MGRRLNKNIIKTVFSCSLLEEYVSNKLNKHSHSMLKKKKKYYHPNTQSYKLNSLQGD